MQPLFAQLKRKLPFYVASLFATAVYAFILKKVFAETLSASGTARILFSTLVTFFHASMTTFLLKTSKISEDVAKAID
ncbi:hypothetical protein J4419_01820 [Candidatus Woesearchaeota archaeon]|nr:hypothetical protein [Candidatus Woesearchaeota archaeon]